ncbi:transcription factor bHLH18-like [Senna tora]|uniref:Transcription factor bHLH18-like n=1 Tax=Senna tora TaxID=362788 RepID=A0A834ST64_9FABA|nr:transcription factor bHLH18-like [Senna tora]
MAISSSTSYLPEFGILEDPTLFEQYSMDYDFQSLVSESGDSYNSCYNNNEVIPERPPRPNKQLKTKPCASNSNLSSFHLISFGEYNSKSNTTTSSTSFASSNNIVKLQEKHNQNLLDFGSAYHTNNNTNYMAATMTRNALQAQDHVMAERKRREKLNQRFITLSSIIPGLKKMDKASVLEDAIKYVKQLQEKEKVLEEQVGMKTAESAVLLRRSHVVLDDDDDDENYCEGGFFNHSLPEIEVRVMGKEVLIRIHCDKHIGCEAAILKELENLHLNVHTTSIIPFGKTTLSITIVAQMEKQQYCMTAKDFVRSLRNTLGQLVR